MRALTIKQPWAWAIATQGKDVENRTWKTAYRGLLAIHAGCSLDGTVEDGIAMMPIESAARALRKVRAEAELAKRLTERAEYLRLGRVVALAEVVGCHPSDECMHSAHLVAANGWTGCSRWAMRGQWHWELASVRLLAKPVRCKGKLGLWHLPEDVEKAVREQVVTPAAP